VSAKRSAPRNLKAAIAKLATLYPTPKPMTDPLALIVWDNIGYLIDDTRRAELFEEFRTRVGLDADKIMRAEGRVLLDIAKRGGMNPGTRVLRFNNIASIARGCGDVGLSAALKSLPLPKARMLLKKFPGIADPGAVLGCQRAAGAGIQRIARAGSPGLCAAAIVLWRELQGGGRRSGGAGHDGT